jgi:predicted MFS family arabinose efflux permease
VPLVRDELGVSNAVGGLHGTALAAGAVITGFLFAPVVGRIGRATAVRFGLLGLVVGILAYTLLPVLPGTLAGAFVTGLAGSFVVTGSVVILGDRHGAAGAAAISEANALAAGTGLLAPLIVGAGVSLGLTWRPGILLAAVAAAAVWFVSHRAARPAPPAAATAPEHAAATPEHSEASPEYGAASPERGAASPEQGAAVVPEPPDAAGESVPITAAGEGAGDRPGPMPGPYWMAFTVVTLCIAVEFCVTFWAADHLRDRTGASAAAATAGITAVVAGMCAGRLAGGRLALLVDSGLLLVGALLVSGLGFGLFWVATSPVPAIGGLAVVGLGLALQYPLGAARAVAAGDGRPDRAAGLLSFAAGLASGGAPFLLGALADRFGTHAAFLLVPALMVLALVGVLLSGRPAARQV